MSATEPEPEPEFLPPTLTPTDLHVDPSPTSDPWENSTFDDDPPPPNPMLEKQSSSFVTRWQTASSMSRTPSDLIKQSSLKHFGGSYSKTAYCGCVWGALRSLYHVTSHFPCPCVTSICLENVLESTVCSFTGGEGIGEEGCPHKFCEECLSGYLGSQITDGNTSVPCELSPSPCPPSDILLCPSCV